MKDLRRSKNAKTAEKSYQLKVSSHWVGDYRKGYPAQLHGGRAGHCSAQAVDPTTHLMPKTFLPYSQLTSGKIIYTFLCDLYWAYNKCGTYYVRVRVGLTHPASCECSEGMSTELFF